MTRVGQLTAFSLAAVSQTLRWLGARSLLVSFWLCPGQWERRFPPPPRAATWRVVFKSGSPGRRDTASGRDWSVGVVSGSVARAKPVSFTVSHLVHSGRLAHGVWWLVVVNASVVDNAVTVTPLRNPNTFLITLNLKENSCVKACEAVFCMFGVKYNHLRAKSRLDWFWRSFDATLSAASLRYLL